MTTCGRNGMGRWADGGLASISNQRVGFVRGVMGAMSLFVLSLKALSSKAFSLGVGRVLRTDFRAIARWVLSWRMVMSGLVFAGYSALALALFSIALTWAFAVVNPSVTATMAVRRMQGDDVRYAWTPLEEISPHMVRAVIASEDMRFCRHHGFDFDAIGAAVRDARAGRGLRGASTISQQTAKNVFLWNGGGYVRKGGEAWFTLWAEVLWSKPRIMEIYLNVAEFGDGIFGVEAAAQVRFGTSAAALTVDEAAVLAAVLPNPHRYRVDPPTEFVLARGRRVRTRMGWVSRDGLDGCL